MMTNGMGLTDRDVTRVTVTHQRTDGLGEIEVEAGTRFRWGIRPSRWTEGKRAGAEAVMHLLSGPHAGVYVYTQWHKED